MIHVSWNVARTIKITDQDTFKMIKYVCVCIYGIHVCMWGGVSLHLSLSSPPSLSLSLSNIQTLPVAVHQAHPDSERPAGGCREENLLPEPRERRASLLLQRVWCEWLFCCVKAVKAWYESHFEKSSAALVYSGYEVAQLTPFYTSNWQIHPRRCCLCCFSFPSVLHTCKPLCNPPLL